MPFTSITRSSGRRPPSRWSALLVRSACGAGILAVAGGLAGCGEPSADGAGQATRPRIVVADTSLSADAGTAPAAGPAVAVSTDAANAATTPSRPLHAPAHPTPVPTMRVRGPRPSDLPKPPPRSTGVTSPSASDPYPSARVKGATAVCADGSWSYTADRAGACATRGGVHWWTGNLGATGPGGH
jgi:serine/threonine-protein kinase